MLLNPDFRDMLSAFSDEGVEYLVVGAYALGAHGFARATKDIDLWVRPSAENAARVMRALVRFGAPLGDATERDFALPGIVFQIGVPPRRIDLLTHVDGVEFEAAWVTRTRASIDGLEVPVLSRAALIASKRAASRPQDLVDIARLESAELASNRVRAEKAPKRPKRSR